MKSVLSIHVLFVFLMAGCATVSTLNKMKRFDLTIKGYENAVQWSDFDAANNYRKDAQTEESLKKLLNLANVTITSYELKHRTVAPDKNRVIQIVELHYYKVEDMVERSIRDHQVWEYDDEANTWYLMGNLLGFK